MLSLFSSSLSIVFWFFNKKGKTSIAFVSSERELNCGFHVLHLVLSVRFVWLTSSEIRFHSIAFLVSRIQSEVWALFYLVWELVFGRNWFNSFVRVIYLFECKCNFFGTVIWCFGWSIFIQRVQCNLSSSFLLTWQYIFCLTSTSCDSFNITSLQWRGCLWSTF